MTGFKIAFVSVMALAAVSGSALAADPLPPEAQSGWYLRGDAGWSWLNWNRRDDNQYMTGVGAGYDFGDFRTDLRFDFAGMYDSTRAADDIYINTLLLNGYYDFDTGTRVTPYIGAGAGYGWVDTYGYDGSGLALAAQVGFEYKINDTFSLDTSYRYRHIFSDRDDTDEHQIMTGVRFGL